MIGSWLEEQIPECVPRLCRRWEEYMSTHHFPGGPCHFPVRQELSHASMTPEARESIILDGPLMILGPELFQYTLWTRNSLCRILMVLAVVLVTKHRFPVMRSNDRFFFCDIKRRLMNGSGLTSFALRILLLNPA